MTEQHAGFALSMDQQSQVFEVLSTVRTMRRLAPDPVPDEILEQLVQAGSWAPTGSNAQAYHFVVVTDRDQIAQLAAIWQKGANLYFGASNHTTPATTEKTAEDITRERSVKAIMYQHEHFAETPAIIVPCYDPTAGSISARQMGFRRMLQTARRLGIRNFIGGRFFGDTANAASIYPAVQNLLIAARTLGLGAALTLFHLAFEREAKEVLGIPKNVHTYALIPIGWPLGHFGKVSRPQPDKIIHRDHWGNSWS
jgi:nitroreductase